MDKIVAINERDGRRIADASKVVERKPKNAPPLRPRYPISQNLPVIHAVTGSGGIPARSGSTMGRALVTVYDITSVDGRTLANSGRQVWCRNRATTAVGGTKDIIACWDSHGLVCLWELCE